MHCTKATALLHISGWLYIAMG